MRTTGCKPANAAPTVRPAKPDSVIGLSMTLFSPNLSSSPLVTLYLIQHVREVHDCEAPGGHLRSIVLGDFFTEYEHLVVRL